MKIVPIQTRTASSHQPAHPLQLRGFWLQSTRILWLAIVFALLSYYLFSFPIFYSNILAYLGSVIQHNRYTYFAVHLLIFVSWVINPLLWLTVGGLLFYQTLHKRNRSIALFPLFASLTLALVGLAMPSLLSQSVATDLPGWMQPFMNGLISAASTLFLLLLFLFPDGRFTPRWLTLPTLLFLALNYGMILFPHTVLSYLDQPPVLFINISLISAGITSQIYKYRHLATRQQRRQRIWALLGLFTPWSMQFVLDLMFLLFAPSPGTYLITLSAWTIFALLLPLAWSVSLLRDHLWGHEIFIRRALVSGILTTLVIAAYIGIVGGLSWLFDMSRNPLIALLATGIIALLFHPVRIHLQRLINRLFYGERDDPYTVISHLIARMEKTITTEDKLAQLTETIAQAFKLPYVALARSDERIVASAGVCNEGQQPLAVPLIYNHEQVATLLCLPPQDDVFSNAELSFLHRLSFQMAAAVHAILLTIELQQARERLILAREEERRRLRRDLHDGLGPTLAGLSLRIDTASKLVHEKPEEAVVLLQALKGQVRSTVADIRHLVYALRPPILDEFGLLSAIREYIIPSVQNSTLTITLDAPKELPPLSAAIEVATFRIIEEAVTNVVRHAHAQHCSIALTLPPHTSTLIVMIQDDGSGISSAYHAGVGMRSMRERAEEIGGSYSLETHPMSGTRICVNLPIMKEEQQWQ